MTGALARLGLARGWARRWLAWLALLGLLAPTVARTEVLAAAEARAVRKVVEAQLSAFAAGDATRAFFYASAGIRAQFGDAGTFMTMVLGAYPMVVRPAATAFFQVQAGEGAKPGPATARQNVQLRDRDGQLWMATYLLERQAGSGWRISGCVVVADNGQLVT